MLKIYTEKDELVAESDAACKIDRGAWCFCMWCNQEARHPCRYFRWDLTETTRICSNCSHEEAL